MCVGWYSGAVVHRSPTAQMPIPARLFRVHPVTALDQLGGFATRAALLSAGVGRRGLEAAVTDGRLRRVSRGVYTVGLADGIAHLTGASVALRAVVSHDSAATLWGLELAHTPGQCVTVPRNRARAAYAGVMVQRADLEDTVVRGGLRVTTPLRTVLDCAATLDLAHAVVVAGSELRAGLLTVDELRSAAGRTRGRRATAVRRVVALVDELSGSVLESLLRVLLVEARLPLPETQWVLRDADGRFVGRVDFANPGVRLLIEADGFEFHRERADYRKDRRRANAYCRADWSLLRFTWEDVTMDPDYVIEAVRAELAKPPREVRRPGVPTSTHKAA